MSRSLTEAIGNRLKAEEFANSIGDIKIKPWVVKNYQKGYVSPEDYKMIIQWIKEQNPNINSYGFEDALGRARNYLSSKKKNDANFDRHAEISGEDHEMDFEDGKFWNIIYPEDCNAIVNRIGFDCSEEIGKIKNGYANGWGLFDDQDNLLCVMMKPADGCTKVFGYGGQQSVIYHKEIHDLCVRKGIPPIPEAYNDSELIEAIQTGLINIKDVHDLREMFKRLKPEDIVSCKLTKYIHYCPLAVAYEVFKLTNLTPILKYLFCLLVSHGFTNTNLYKLVRKDVMSNSSLHSEMSEIDSIDTRVYVDKMEEAIKEISEN
jgi:hypothetical protein